MQVAQVCVTLVADRNSPGESTPVSAALLAKVRCHLLAQRLLLFFAQELQVHNVLPLPQIKALETAEKKAGTPLAVKRGPGRQPKTPKAATPAVTAEPSTMRTRGSARTPAK